MRGGGGRQGSALFFLVACALLLGGVLTGIYLFFPHEALKLRIEQEVGKRPGVRVRIGDFALVPPLTLSAGRVAVDLDVLPQPLLVDSLKLSPLWATLLSGDQGGVLQGALMGGTVDAELRRSGAIGLRASGLNLDIPLDQPLPMRLTGTLDQATLASVLRLPDEAATDLSLRLSGVRVAGLQLPGAGEGGLLLGDLQLDVVGQGRKMEVRGLVVRGGVFEVTGGGTALVGRSAESSRLNLDLLVKPGANADPTLVSLLRLAGEPDAEGRYSLRVGGTFARPALKSGD